VKKQRSQRFDVERFNLKTLNDVDGKEQFRVDASNIYADLEDLNAGLEIDSVWEMIRVNIKIVAKQSRLFGI
jgi:hypothetical protein